MARSSNVRHENKIGFQLLRKLRLKSWLRTSQTVPQKRKHPLSTLGSDLCVNCVQTRGFNLWTNCLNSPNPVPCPPPNMQIEKVKVLTEGQEDPAACHFVPDVRLVRRHPGGGGGGGGESRQCARAF